VFVKIRRRKRAGQTYQYVDIVESRRREGKVVRATLGTLGRLEDLPPAKIDALITHLRRLASPEGDHGISGGALDVIATRQYGLALAARHLWEELGLGDQLRQLSARPGATLEEAVFRMVVNRLADPHSKLALVDWEDEQGQTRPGWQGQVEWRSDVPALDYNHYLRAMDGLHPHRQAIEDRVFSRVTELFSLPLQLLFYDVSSTYFEGDGVCELARYGYSRDHRDDRAQILVGLAVTQEGFPITHQVLPGDTVDVTTVQPMAQELKARFGLERPVLVADRGMVSAENLAALEAQGFRYVLALRERQQNDARRAIALAEHAGLEKPKDPSAPRTWREVQVAKGVRHVVIYSAFRALHDGEVRQHRLEQTRTELAQLQRRASKANLSERQCIERATRILVGHKTRKYFTYEASKGEFRYRLNRAVYRRERGQDGIFVLQTNHPTLTPADVLASYVQLQEVERAFRVLKSVVKVRPMYHWKQRRVETHIFINFLAYLLAKVLEQKLKRANIPLSIPRALEHLARLQAVEHTWEKQARVVKATRPDQQQQQILDALGVRIANRVLSVSRQAA